MQNSLHNLKTISFTILLLSCSPAKNELSGSVKNIMTKEKNKKEIGIVLDAFNKAAAKADYKAYFDFFAPDAVFIGTDANENWDKQSFMSWAKPYFDKGKAWDFTSIDRHVYVDKNGRLAWFDELLNTQMKICRGSGVMEKTDKGWKIKQYVLSMTMPNSQVDNAIRLKAPVEEKIIDSLSNKK